MPIDAETKKVLLRWQALCHPEGLQRIKSLALWLRLIAIALICFVVLAVGFGLPVVWVVVGALLCGWLSSEAEALRTRLSQWRIFSQYLDWRRIERDLDAT
jgi:hypothetical protein